MNMNILVERLERATGPDRGLDLQIMRAGFKHQVLKWEEAGWDEDGKDFPDGIRYWTDEREKSYAVGVERFTSSIDAAMTLVPEGMYYKLERFSDGCYAAVCPYSRQADQTLWRGHQKPAAIALCIAALKARDALAHSPTASSAPEVETRGSVRPQPKSCCGFRHGHAKDCSNYEDAATAPTDTAAQGEEVMITVHKDDIVTCERFATPPSPSPTPEPWTKCGSGVCYSSKACCNHPCFADKTTPAPTKGEVTEIEIATAMMNTGPSFGEQAKAVIALLRDKGAGSR